MFLFTTEPKDSIGGPLWFIQLWAYAYFPQLAPKLDPSVLSRISFYAHLFALSAYEPDHIPTFEDWFNLFSDKERVRPAPHFLPFAEAKFTCPEMFLLRDVNITSSKEEDTVHAKPLQTVLPSPKRSIRVKQRAAKKATKAKKQTIKTETPTRGKRKIILPSSDSEPKEQLTRKHKQQKVEAKEKEVLEEEAPTQTKTSSCTQVFKRRSKGIVIKDSTVEKDLASALAKANQVIASQRQEITALSIKAHQDAVSIITKEIPVHLSSLEKKQKLVAKKERAIKIKQEQTLQVEAAMEAKKKDAKPLSQQPLLDTPIIKVDIEDLSEPEVDQLIKKASSVLEEMKSASKVSTSSTSKTPASPVSQGMNAISNLLTEDMLGMLALFSESLDSKLLHISTAISNEKEIQSIQKGYDEQITAKSEFQQEFEQTLKKYEDTKQEISKVRKELQRLENVQDLTQMKLQDLIKQKDNIIDSSTEISLEEKITSLTTEV
uniref:Aminotransferase-like plant mobile domain-containing protein n=1 Tax=Fagus sylvatica TaxID=28930 RepID=A0A2N9EF36_FAGSY